MNSALGMPIELVGLFSSSVAISPSQRANQLFSIVSPTFLWKKVYTLYDIVSQSVFTTKTAVLCC